MIIDFIKMKESENLIPIEIPRKEEYLLDLINIEDNFTGRAGTNSANTFILESAQLIKNAVFLFEKGYFDCAFYSLRQSLEISTTMVYLTDTDDEKAKKEMLKKWKEKNRFPMYKEMINLLKEKGPVFKDIKESMEEYFNELDCVKSKINKYVHKQGFDTFYISRSHPLSKKDNKAFLLEFEEYLRKSIGAAAVFRLAIDPFPVLLMDKNIFNRTGDTLPQPYSEEFVEKYIGLDCLENYKCTAFFKNTYKSIMLKEEQKDFITNILKYYYIDREKIKEILEQKHLLDSYGLFATCLIGFSKKTCMVYCFNGMIWYHTNIQTVRKNKSYSSERINDFLTSGQQFNNKYDEAFISVVKIEVENYFIEHNEEFDQKEMSELEELIKLLEEKYCEAANITKR
jgi:hypothetical protein